MASATSGELSVMTTGAIYCLMLCSCLALQDYRRAGEWTEVVDRCGHTTGHGGFPGDCRTHRTDVLVKRGAWAQGEEEALRAFDETQAFDLIHAGAASYSLGELRLRRGDVDAAEEAFLRAHEFSYNPQPGLALVQLVRGEAAAALASVGQALKNPALDRLERVRLVLAKVEIALVQADPEALHATAEELEQTTTTIETPALAASAAYARGAAELTDGNSVEAARLFELTHQRWLDAEAPYEAARARELHARAQLASGRADAGRLALLATRAAFQRPGARLDTERVELQLERAHLTERAPSHLPVLTTTGRGVIQSPRPGFAWAHVCCREPRVGGSAGKRAARPLSRAGYRALAGLAIAATPEPAAEARIPRSAGKFAASLGCSCRGRSRSACRHPAPPGAISSCGRRALRRIVPSIR
jgi:hypothetical protein